MRNNDPEIDAHFILDDKNYGIFNMKRYGPSGRPLRSNIYSVEFLAKVDTH